MRIFLTLKTGITKFNYTIALIGAVVVFLTMFLMTADVTARYFKWPFQGAVELTEIALGLMVYLGWAYTQEQRGHITIDIFYNKLPPSVKKFLTLINPLFGLVFMGVILWQGVDFALYSRESGEITENLALPVWPFKMIISLGAATFCLQLLLDMVQAVLDFKEN